jgi:hypothetical protein
VADSPGSLRLAREQTVGDPIVDDLVVATLVGRLPQIEVVAGSPAPDWQEPLAREIPLQPRKEVVDVVREPIRKDKPFGRRSVILAAPAKDNDNKDGNSAIPCLDDHALRLA